MSNKAIVVFTFRSTEHILEMRGTEAWTCTEAGAKACKYVVMTRNTNGVPPRKGHPGIAAEGDEPHRSAFMIGKISDVVHANDQSDDPKERRRYRIEFEEWAPLALLEVWQKDRLPFRYMTLEEIGIDPDKLDWRPMPVPAWADPISAFHEAVDAEEKTKSQIVREIAEGRGLPVVDIPLRSIEEIVTELKGAIALDQKTTPDMVKVNVEVQTKRELAF